MHCDQSVYSIKEPWFGIERNQSPTTACQKKERAITRLSLDGSRKVCQWSRHQLMTFENQISGIKESFVILMKNGYRKFYNENNQRSTTDLPATCTGTGMWATRVLLWPRWNRCRAETGREGKHLQLVIGDRDVSVEIPPISSTNYCIS